MLLLMSAFWLRRRLYFDTCRDTGVNFALLMRPQLAPPITGEITNGEMKHYKTVQTGQLRHFVPEFRGTISGELASWFNCTFKHAVQIGMADVVVRCNTNGGHPVTRYLEDVFQYKAMSSAAQQVAEGVYDEVTDCGQKAGKFNHLFCSALEFWGARRVPFEANIPVERITLTTLCIKVLLSDPDDLPDALHDKHYELNGVRFLIQHRVLRETFQDYDERAPARTCHFVNDTHYYLPGYRCRRTCFVAGMNFSNVPGLHHLPSGEGYVEISSEENHQRLVMTTAQNEKPRYDHANVVMATTARAAYSVGYITWGYWYVSPGQVICHQVPRVNIDGPKVCWSAARFTRLCPETWTPAQMLSVVPRHIAEDCVSMGYVPNDKAALAQYRALVESGECDGLESYPRYFMHLYRPVFLSFILELDFWMALAFIKRPFLGWYLGSMAAIRQLVHWNGEPIYPRPPARRELVRAVRIEPPAPLPLAIEQERGIVANDELPLAMPLNIVFLGQPEEHQQAIANGA